jgi:hypothetical protein
MTGNTLLLNFFSVPLKYAGTGDFKVLNDTTYSLTCHQTQDGTQDHYTFTEREGKVPCATKISNHSYHDSNKSNPSFLPHFVDTFVYYFPIMWNSTVTPGTLLRVGRLGFKSQQEQKNSCPKHPDWLQSMSTATY